MSFYDKDKLDKLKRAHDKVRASMNPQQLAIAEAVDQAFNEEAASFDERQEKENALRQWAFNLLGVKLDISELEEFRDFCKARNPGMFTYAGKRGFSRILVKTAFGQIDDAERYLLTLEREPLST